MLITPVDDFEKPWVRSCKARQAEGIDVAERQTACPVFRFIRPCSFLSNCSRSLAFKTQNDHAVVVKTRSGYCTSQYGVDTVGIDCLHPTFQPNLTTHHIVLRGRECVNYLLLAEAGSAAVLVVIMGN